MIKIYFLILLQVMNVISSDINYGCYLKNDILSPTFKLINGWGNIDENYYADHGSKVVLTCRSGKIRQSPFAVHEISGVCKGDHILDNYGYKIYYYDFECDFYEVMKIKFLPNTIQCPKPLTLLSLGFKNNQHSSLVYQMCFNNDTAKANYIYEKLSYNSDYDVYGYLQEAIIAANKDYFNDAESNGQTIDESLIIQQLKSIVEKKHDFGYNIEPLFQLQDSYTGIFNISQSEYLWRFTKHEKVGYVTVTLINGNSTQEYFCETQIPNEIIAEDRQKSFDFQLCKYEDLKKTIPEMPTFGERIRFVAGTDFS